MIIFPRSLEHFSPKAATCKPSGTPSGLGHRGTRARCPEFLGHLGHMLILLKKIPQKYIGHVNYDELCE